MAVDYREQYTPEQLEPFWPSEVIRLVVSALCTLAVITVLAVLPVVLHYWGLGHWVEASEPANPRATPAHIKPEWYFLPAYQYLKLAPQEFLGVSGKTIGVVSQGVFLFAVLLLPFWGRRWSRRPTGSSPRDVCNAGSRRLRAAHDLGGLATACADDDHALGCGVRVLCTALQ